MKDDLKYYNDDASIKQVLYGGGYILFVSHFHGFIFGTIN